MKGWCKKLKIDPIPALLSTENIALLYFVKRDLLEENVGSIEELWELPEVQSSLNKQQINGSWYYPGGKKDLRTRENYDQIETYRQLGFLIEKYGFNKQHQVIRKTTNFYFHFKQ